MAKKSHDPVIAKALEYEAASMRRPENLSPVQTLSRS
jgi:hypothetical protein